MKSYIFEESTLHFICAVFFWVLVLCASWRNLVSLTFPISAQWLRRCASTLHLRLGAPDTPTKLKSPSLYLIDNTYDRRTNEIVAENLKKAENEVAVLDQIAEFLVQNKFEKAKDHQDKVKELEEEVAASWNRYQTNIHISHRISSSHKTPPSRPRFPVCEIGIRIETRHLITWFISRWADNLVQEIWSILSCFKHAARKKSGPAGLLA